MLGGCGWGWGWGVASHGSRLTNKPDCSFPVRLAGWLSKNRNKKPGIYCRWALNAWLSARQHFNVSVDFCPKGSFPRIPWLLLCVFIVSLPLQARSSSHSFHPPLQLTWRLGGRGPRCLAPMGDNGPSARSHVLVMLTENPMKMPARRFFAVGRRHSALYNVKLWVMWPLDPTPPTCCECNQRH